MTISLSIDRYFQREFGKNFADTELGKIATKLPFFTKETEHSAIDGGPWIAGGALRRALMGEPMGGDIDIFFRHAGQLDAFLRDLPRPPALTTLAPDKTDKRRIALVLDGLGIKLDLVRAVFFANTQQLLADFDFTCCCVATDGTTLWMDQYALFDNARRVLRVNNPHKMKCSLKHMERYLRMGFSADNTCLNELLQYGANERAKSHFEYSGPPTTNDIDF